MDDNIGDGRDRERRGPRVPWFGAFAVATTLLVSGCGQSRFHYVANKADGVYFKVPTAWTVLSVDTSTSGSDALPHAWQTGFDTAKAPSLDHVQADAPDELTGRATVLYVDASTSDRLSPAGVRAFLSGLDDDPLAVAESDPTKVTVQSIETLAAKGGLKGSRIVYEMKTESGVAFTRDQTSLIDPNPYPNPKSSSGSAMYKVYVLELRCASTCFAASKQAVRDVVDSWQVIR